MANSLNDLNRALKKMIPVLKGKGLDLALFAGAEFLKEEAKKKFGHYQQGWKQLAPATIKDRIRKGYTPNDPLLRDGTLRDSIKAVALKDTAYVGSDSDIMVYQELGTAHIPPRPVLMPTALENGEEAVLEMAKVIGSLLLKGSA